MLEPLPVRGAAGLAVEPLLPELGETSTTVAAGPSTGTAGAHSGEAAATAEVPGRSELRRRRDALAEQVAELHWDLGGLAYEMAIRDHFRLDVLVRRAAVLQERDAELAELERLLRMEDGGVSGSCATCGAPHSRGAMFCWQCGSPLMERRPSADALGDADTEMLATGDGSSMMDALLAPRDSTERDR
jgi:hypothetical protein